MPEYRYADLTVAATFPLPELPPAGGEREPPGGLIEARLLDVPPAEPADGDWRHHWSADDGTTMISLARRGEGYLLRFPGLADFVVSGDAGHVGAWPADGTGRETLRHLLLDQVLPRLLAHHGRMVLHASAVEVDGRALAFAGETGRGKSTLAASLHGAGWPLLGDDALIVAAARGRATALPVYGGLRLWPSAAEATAGGTMLREGTEVGAGKRRMALPEAGPSAARPLAALYVLAPPPAGREREVEVTRLGGRDACIQLIRNAFQLDVGDRERAGGLLAAAAEIAAMVPVFELAYPRDYDLLPEVHATIRRQAPGRTGGVDGATDGGWHT